MDKTDSFTDFPFLRDTISEEQDKILFDEVVRCIESEAYRAAFIIIWIGIAESLYNKVDKMAYRDSTIKKSKDIIDGCNPKDKELLVQCEKVGIINDKEFTKLESIRKTRNSYAHPTRDAPSKKEVLCAINSSVSIVLSRPPLLRFAYAEDFINSLLNDFHYFEDDTELIEKYAENFINKLHSDVYQMAFTKLLKGSEKLIFESNYQMRKIRDRGLVFGSKLLFEILENEILDDIDDFLNKCLDEYKFSSCNIFTDDLIWEYLNQRTQNRIFGYLLAPSKEEKSFSRSSSIKIIYGLYNNDKLQGDFKTRFESLFDSMEYDIFLESDLPLEIIFNRVIDDLNSHNYYKQNPAVEFLKDSGLSRLETLNDEYLEVLGRNILQSAEGGSHNAKNYIDYIDYRSRKDIFWPQKFIEGLVLETLINENKEFRFKNEKFLKTLKISINHPNSEEILNRLLLEFSESSPKREWCYNDYEHVIGALNKNSFAKKILVDNPKIDKLIELSEKFRDQYGTS